MAIQEVPAEQEEERCEGDNSGIAQYVSRNHRADKDHKRVGRQQWYKEDEQEVEERPT